MESSRPVEQRGVAFSDEAKTAQHDPDTFITSVGLEGVVGGATSDHEEHTTPSSPPVSSAAPVASQVAERPPEPQPPRRRSAAEEAVAAANAHDAWPELSAEYYSHLPFQPGVDSLLWLALQAASGRPLTGLRLPHTLISDGTDTAWLSTRHAYDDGAEPTLTVKLGGSLDDKWITPFRKACVAHSCFDLGTAAELAAGRLRARAASPAAPSARGPLPQPSSAPLSVAPVKSTGRSPAASPLASPPAFGSPSPQQDVSGFSQEALQASASRSTSWRPKSASLGRTLASGRGSLTQSARPASAAAAPATKRATSQLRHERLANRQAELGADLRITPLAVMKSPARWAGACRSEVAVLPGPSLAPRLHTADRDKFLVQAYVKSKGRSPLVYRCTWKAGSPPTVLAMHCGGEYVFTLAPRDDAGQPRQPSRRVEHLLAPPSDAGIVDDAAGASTGAAGVPVSRVGGVSAAEEADLTRRFTVSTALLSGEGGESTHQHRADGQSFSLSSLAAAQAGVFSATRMAGRAVQEPIRRTRQLVKAICAGVPSAWGWASSAHGDGPATCGMQWLTADFVKDDAGLWWMLQVKAFKLTPAAEQRAVRLKRVLHWLGHTPGALQAHAQTAPSSSPRPSSGRGGGEGPVSAFAAPPASPDLDSSDSDSALPTQAELEELRTRGDGSQADQSQALASSAAALLHRQRSTRPSAAGSEGKADTGGEQGEAGSPALAQTSTSAEETLSLAEQLMHGGSALQVAPADNVAGMAKAVQGFVRELGFASADDIPLDGQLHLAQASGLRSCVRGGGVSSDVRARAVASRMCHLCRLRFTPQELMPAHTVFLQEAAAMAREAVAARGGMVPERTSEGAGVGGLGMSLRASMPHEQGGSSTQPTDVSGAARQAGLTDAMGLLRAGKEWGGHLDSLAAFHASGGMWRKGDSADGHIKDTHRSRMGQVAAKIDSGTAAAPRLAATAAQRQVAAAEAGDEDLVLSGQHRAPLSKAAEFVDGMTTAGVTSSTYSSRGLLPRSLKGTAKLLAHIQSVDELVAGVDATMQAADPLKPWPTQRDAGAQAGAAGAGQGAVQSPFGRSPTKSQSVSSVQSFGSSAALQRTLSQRAAASPDSVAFHGLSTSLQSSTAALRRTVSQRLTRARHAGEPAAAGLQGITEQYATAVAANRHSNSAATTAALIEQAQDHSSRLQRGLDERRAKARAQRAARRQQAEHDKQLRETGTLFGMSDQALAAASRKSDAHLEGAEAAALRPAFSVQLSKHMLSTVAQSLQHRGWSAGWLSQAVASAQIGSSSAQSGQRGGLPAAAEGVASALNPSASSAADSLLAATAYNKVSVCNLCYAVYQAQRKLQTVAKEFASAIGLHPTLSNTHSPLGQAVAAEHAKVPIRPLASVIGSGAMRGEADQSTKGPGDGGGAVMNWAREGEQRRRRQDAERASHRRRRRRLVSTSGQSGTSSGAEDSSASGVGSLAPARGGWGGEQEGDDAWSASDDGDSGDISHAIRKRQTQRAEAGMPADDVSVVPGFEEGQGRYSASAELVGTIGVQALGPLPESRKDGVVTGLSGLQQIGGETTGSGDRPGTAGALSSAYELMTVAARAAFDEASSAAQQHLAARETSLVGSPPSFGPSPPFPSAMTSESKGKVGGDPLTFDERFSRAVQAAFSVSQGVGSLHRGVSPSRVKAGDVPWALVSAVVDALSENPTWVDALLSKLPITQPNAVLEAMADTASFAAASGRDDMDFSEDHEWDDTGPIATREVHRQGAAGVLQEYGSVKARRAAVRTAIELKNLALLKPVTRGVVVASLLNVAVNTRTRDKSGASSAARRLAHVPANLPHIGRLTRVPIGDVHAAAAVAGLPAERLHQFRVVFFFRHFQGLPSVTEDEALLAAADADVAAAQASVGSSSAGDIGRVVRHVSPSVAKQVRHLEWRYSVLHDEHRVPFKCRLPVQGTGSGALGSVVGINALKVHYIVASPATIVQMLSTQTVTLDLIAVFTRYVACDKVGKVVGVVRTVDSEEDGEGFDAVDHMAMQGGTSVQGDATGIASAASSGFGSMSFAGSSHWAGEGRGGAAPGPPLGMHVYDQVGAGGSGEAGDIPLPIPQARLVLASWARPHDVVRFEKRVFHERFEGKAALHFLPFVAAGVGLTKQKHDFVIPVSSHRLGTLQLAVSVGIVRDEPPGTPSSAPPSVEGQAGGGSDVQAVAACQSSFGGGSNQAFRYYFTKGNGVLWPPEWFFDYRPLPREWLGTLGASTAQGVCPPSGGPLSPALVKVSSTFTLSQRQRGTLEVGNFAAAADEQLRGEQHPPAEAEEDVTSRQTESLTPSHAPTDLGEVASPSLLGRPLGVVWGGARWSVVANGLPLNVLSGLLKRIVTPTSAGPSPAPDSDTLESSLPHLGLWLQERLLQDAFASCPGAAALPDFGSGHSPADVLRALFTVFTGGYDLAYCAGVAVRRNGAGVPGAHGWYLPAWGSGDSRKGGTGSAGNMPLQSVAPDAGLRPARCLTALVAQTARLPAPPPSSATLQPAMLREGRGWCAIGSSALALHAAQQFGAPGAGGVGHADGEVSARLQRTLFLPVPALSGDVVGDMLPLMGEGKLPAEAAEHPYFRAPAPIVGSQSVPASILVQYAWLHERAALKADALRNRGSNATTFLSSLRRGGEPGSSKRDGRRASSVVQEDSSVPLMSVRSRTGPSASVDTPPRQHGPDAPSELEVSTSALSLPSPQDGPGTRHGFRPELHPDSKWTVVRQALREGAFKPGGRARLTPSIWLSLAALLESNWRPPEQADSQAVVVQAAMQALGLHSSKHDRSRRKGRGGRAPSDARLGSTAGSARTPLAESSMPSPFSGKAGFPPVPESTDTPLADSTGTLEPAAHAGKGVEVRDSSRLPLSGPSDRRLTWGDLCAALQAREVSDLRHAAASAEQEGKLDVPLLHKLPIVIAVAEDGRASVPAQVVPDTVLAALSRRAGVQMFVPFDVPAARSPALALRDSRHRQLRRQVLFRQLFHLADSNVTGDVDIGELRATLLQEGQLYLAETRKLLATRQPCTRADLLGSLCSGIETRRFMARWLLQDAALNGLMGAYVESAAGRLSYLEWMAVAECAFHLATARGHPLSAVVWGFSDSLGREAPVMAADRYCACSLHLQLQLQGTVVAAQQVALGSPLTVSSVTGKLLPSPGGHRLQRGVQPPLAPPGMTAPARGASLVVDTHTPEADAATPWGLPPARPADLASRQAATLPVSFACASLPLHCDPGVVFLGKGGVISQVRHTRSSTPHLSASDLGWGGGSALSQHSDSGSSEVGTYQPSLASPHREPQLLPPSSPPMRAWDVAAAPGPRTPPKAEAAHAQVRKAARNGATSTPWSKPAAKAPSPAPRRRRRRVGDPQHASGLLASATVGSAKALPPGYVPSPQQLRGGEGMHSALQDMLAAQGARQEGWEDDGAFSPATHLLRPSSPLHTGKAGSQAAKARRRPRPASAVPRQASKGQGGSHARLRLAASKRRRPASALPSTTPMVHGGGEARRAPKAAWEGEGRPASASRKPRRAGSRRGRRKGLTLRSVGSAAGMDRIGGKRIRKARLEKGLPPKGMGGSGSVGGGASSLGAGSAWGHGGQAHSEASFHMHSGPGDGDSFVDPFSTDL